MAYMITTDHGDCLSDGLPEQTARPIAQQVANRLNRRVWLTESHDVVNDVDIFQAAMPRVLPGGQTILSSTPWAEAGLLYDEFVANHPEPVAFTREIVAAETARNPENAQRATGRQPAQPPRLADREPRRAERARGVQPGGGLGPSEAKEGSEMTRNPKADRHRPRRNIKIPHADMDKVTRWEAAAKRRGLSLTSFLVLAAELLAGCAVPLEPTAEDVARGDEPAQQAPRANFCLAETYARDLCGPDMAPSVCNGTTECTLVEVIPMRDEQATPLPNQESIYWRRFPPGPRYVYCCE